ELELERSDVPAGPAELERAAAEAVAGEATERAARLRPNDPVDDEPGALLESPDRLRGGRTLDPVDRTVVEPMRAQADLEGGYARIERRGAGAGDDSGGDENEGQRE